MRLPELTVTTMGSNRLREREIEDRTEFHLPADGCIIGAWCGT